MSDMADKNGFTRRKTFRLNNRQADFLEEMTSRGMNEAALVRQAIDKMMSDARKRRVF